jgi:hypothetical protein
MLDDPFANVLLQEVNLLVDVVDFLLQVRLVPVVQEAAANLPEHYFRVIQHIFELTEYLGEKVLAFPEAQ